MVDTFTAWLPRARQRGLDALWDLVYAAHHGAHRLAAGASARATPSRSQHHLDDARPAALAGAIAACARCMALFLGVVAVATALRAAAEAADERHRRRRRSASPRCWLLIALRMPVGLAMLVVGSAGYIYLVGLGAVPQLHEATPYYLFANYTLSVIPLFILMGAFAERSGLRATCSRRRAPSSAICAAGSPWR